MRESFERVEFVEVKYWSCNSPIHRHKTKDVADRCIKKNSKKVSRPSLAIRRLRHIAAFKAVLNGATLKEAGEIIGVSGSRATQLIHGIIRRSIHSSRFSGEVPEHDWYNVKDFRKYREFWLERASCMEQEWSKNP